MKDVYLISPSAVKAITSVNLNVTDDILSYAIRNAQDMRLKFIIGDELLEALQNQAQQKITIGKEVEEPYRQILYDYVVPFLASQTVVEVCIPMTFKIRNIGVVKNNDINAESQSLDEVLRIKSYYEGVACDAANRLSDYLKDNAANIKEISRKKCGENKHYAAIGLYLG